MTHRAILMRMISVFLAVIFLSACGETGGTAYPTAQTTVQAPQTETAAEPSTDTAIDEPPQTTAAPQTTQAPVTDEKPQTTQLQTETAEKVLTYVLNTSTKKFHKPSCSSVETIKDKNREDYTGTRSSVIARGMDPCGRCKP